MIYALRSFRHPGSIGLDYNAMDNSFSQSKEWWEMEIDGLYTQSGSFKSDCSTITEIALLPAGIEDLLKYFPLFERESTRKSKSDRNALVKKINSVVDSRLGNASSGSIGWWKNS